MKKWISLMVLACLLLTLSGCRLDRKNDSKVIFYFCNVSLPYQETDAVLAPVSQPSNLKKTPLKELIAMYLQTPGSQSFSNKLYSSKIYEMVQEHTKLYLTLSNEVRYLEGIDLTIGCVCLAKTVFSLTEYETLIIDCQSGIKYVEGPLVHTRSNIMLTDT